MIKKVATLAAGLTLVPAAVAGAASWTPGGGPDYVPVPEGVIEHRVVEATSNNPDGSPYERRQETWTSTTRQHSILVDSQNGKLLSEDVTVGGTWRSFAPSSNKLWVFKLDQADRPATASARTQAATLKAEVEAGALKVKGSTTYNGVPAVTLETGPTNPNEGEFPTTYVVEPGTYRVLESSAVLTGTLESSDKPFVTTNTMRTVTLEDLPATPENIAKLTMQDPPGAEIRTSESDGDMVKAFGARKGAKKKATKHASKHANKKATKKAKKKATKKAARNGGLRAAQR